MCLVSFASSLDSTIITTTLPTITREFKGQQQYVRMASLLVLASTGLQPSVGQLSNTFGRRMPMIISVALFAAGSGITGALKSVGMIIASQIVQGLGSGGVFVLVELITCNLVPLRERENCLGIMLSAAAIETTIGPLLGGGLA